MYPRSSFFHINFRMNKGRQNMCVLTLFNMLFYVKMILIISLTFFIYFINQTQLKYITPELFDFKHWPKSYFVIFVLNKYASKQIKIYNTTS